MIKAGDITKEYINQNQEISDHQRTTSFTIVKTRKNTFDILRSFTYEFNNFYFIEKNSHWNIYKRCLGSISLISDRSDYRKNLNVE